MPKMDICTCKITLAGDKRQVVVRGPTNPLTYPEVNLMMYMHGERYVEDIEVIGQVDTDNQSELQNLRVKYKHNARAAFPGSRPRLPLEAPGDIPRNLDPKFEKRRSDLVAPQISQGEQAPAQRRRKPRNEAA